MKRVEIKLNLEAVAPLLDVMKTMADQLEPRLAVEQEVPDPEFADTWRQELLAGQKSDIAVLLGLFDSEFFSGGVIALDPSNAEQILRACAAIRLRLREIYFKELEEEHLESGDIDVDDFAEPLRRAFAAYVFLATLQEVIVQHLDPTVIE